MLRSIQRIPRASLMATMNMSNSACIPKERLKDKVAIVTASTDGIGYAIAERLANEGASVLISSRHEKNVISAVEKLKNQGLNVEGVVCHVGKSEDRTNLFKTVVEKFGGLDILVSNAAVNPGVGYIFNVDESMWDKIFDINVKASFLLSREAIPLFHKRGGGNIVYISSVSGYKPIDNLGAYSVSKTALFGLTKAASIDVAKENIRINCVAPGLISTNFASVLTRDKKIFDATLNLIPMGRTGTSQEIGATVAFLVSDDAGYITGETIVAAGGAASRI